MKLLVVGGRMKAHGASLDEWQRFERARVVIADSETGSVEPVYDYLTPPEARPTEGSILFKAACLREDRLLLCTQTEVLELAWPSLERLRYLSPPFFNDVHHVCATDAGTLLVANTGLDMVHEFGPEGEVLREWDALGREPWTARPRGVDYRKVLTTKPHASHPNFAFEADGEIWTTRFEQRDVVCLTDPSRRIAIDLERPHDGILHEGELYFTTVDGRVVVASPDENRVLRSVDLNEIQTSNRVLGWCRSLAVLERDLVVVGFSRVRRTEFMQNVAWIARRARGVKGGRLLPSRIALYDLARRRLLWEVNIENAGVNAIFSIHPLSR